MSFRFCRLMAVVSILVATTLAATAQTASGAGAAAGASTAAGAGTTTSAGVAAVVHGLVVDQENALVPGATVTLTSTAGKAGVGKALTATTKSDGTYSFRNVSAGTYSLTVKAAGFASFSKPAINVVAGANLDVDATLPLAEQEQEVNVTANPVTLSVDPDSNASATVISGAALDALSDDPDELETELTALAGPSAGPNGGQIYIDGFTGGQLPPKSSILAIRVNQNPFSAQYDRLGYGRIEIITKPGTDKLHGSFMTMYNRKAFNTSTPYLGATGQPDYHTLFFMGNVTGPIKQGMSFNLSGSHRAMDNNTIVNPSAFYSKSADSTALCDPGAVGGSYTTCSSYSFPTWARAEATPADRWDISPRIDTMLGSKNTLTVRYQYESGTSNVKPTVDSAILNTGSNSYNNEQEIQVSETQLISSKVINETRFEYQHSSSHSTPLNTTPSIGVTGAFSVGGGTIASGTGDQVEVQNYTSIQLAKNFVRFGGRLRTSSKSNYSNSGANGSFTYDNLLDPCTDPNVPLASKPSNCVVTSTALQASDLASQICAGSSTTTLISSYQCGIVSQFGLKKITNYTVGARETDVGLYAEDDWKLKPNLTISYGLRFETENVIHSNHDLAPRVSLAYGIPRKNGKTTTVLRGGFGVFYDRFSLNKIQSQLINNGQNSTSSTYSSPGASCTPTQGGATPYSLACTTGTATAAKVTNTLLDPNLRSAYILQSAATVEQQIGKYASVSVTYLNARGEHQYLSRTLPTGTAYPTYNQSEGVFRQNQININTNIRTPKGITIFGYYSANWANANDSSISDPSDPSVDYGRASFGTRSRLFLGGSIPLPYGISASPMIQAQSGSPYNITLGKLDSVTLGSNDRPEFASGVTPATANCLDRNSFQNANVLDSTGAVINSNPHSQVPVNFCTGPASVSFNMRLARTFGFGPKTAAALAAAAAAKAQGDAPSGPPPGERGSGRSGGGGGGGGGSRGGGGGPGGPPPGGGSSSTGRKYNVTLEAMARNLFNEIPYSTPNSNWNSPQFGKTTSVTSGNSVRQIMLGARFSF